MNVSLSTLGRCSVSPNSHWFLLPVIFFSVSGSTFSTYCLQWKLGALYVPVTLSHGLHSLPTMLLLPLHTSKAFHSLRVYCTWPWLGGLLLVLEYC